MKKSVSVAIAFVLCLIVAGCGSESKSREIEFHFKKSTMKKTLHFKGLIEPAKATSVSLKKGYGTIEWMAPEGQFVASGETIVKLRMDDAEEGFRDADLKLFKVEKDKEEKEISTPYDISLKRKDFFEKKLLLEQGRFDHYHLLKGETEDKIKTAESEKKKNLFELSFSQAFLEFQKQIAKKGFSSSFDLQSREIDTFSKEVELDYSKRYFDKLFDPPLEEELTKTEYQIDVASGELWLSRNNIVSASLSAQIIMKSAEAVVEMRKARWKSYKETLEQKVICAPHPGMVIVPTLWGVFKFSVGQQVWPRVGFMKIAGNEGFYVSAIVDETISSELKQDASATVRLEADPEKVFQAKIRSISKSAKSSRGKQSGFKKFPVELDINYGSNTLTVGSKVDVSVDLVGSDGVYIPRDAVKEDGKKKFLKLKNTLGVSEVEVDLEVFDADWFLWKNPSQQEGKVLY